MSERYDIEELPEGKFPIYFILIYYYQREDPFLTEKPKCAEFTKGSYCRGRNTIGRITYKDKIVIPQKLQKYIVKWYQTRLQYPRLY